MGNSHSQHSVDLSEEEALDEIAKKRQAIKELLEEEVINKKDSKACSDGANMNPKPRLQQKKSKRSFSQNSMSSYDIASNGKIQEQLQEIKRSV